MLGELQEMKDASMGHKCTQLWCLGFVFALGLCLISGCGMRATPLEESGYPGMVELVGDFWVSPDRIFIKIESTQVDRMRLSDQGYFNMFGASYATRAGELACVFQQTIATNGGFDAYDVWLVSPELEVIRTGELVLNADATIVGLVEVAASGDSLPDELGPDTFSLGVIYTYSDDQTQSLQGERIRIDLSGGPIAEDAILRLELIDWRDDAIELKYGFGNMLEVNAVELRTPEPFCDIRQVDSVYRWFCDKSEGGS